MVHVPESASEDEVRRHLLEHNHTPAFRRIMDRVLPDLRQREADLDSGWQAYVAFGIDKDGKVVQRTRRE